MTNNPEPVAHADLVERLRALYVWPQFVADNYADALLPRQMAGLYAVGHVADEAAAEILRLRAEIARKDEALRALAEGNLGPMPWQAGYDRIREVARAALKEQNQ